MIGEEYLKIIAYSLAILAMAEYEKRGWHYPWDFEENGKSYTSFNVDNVAHNVLSFIYDELALLDVNVHHNEPNEK